MGILSQAEKQLLIIISEGKNIFIQDEINVMLLNSLGNLRSQGFIEHNTPHTENASGNRETDLITNVYITKTGKEFLKKNL
jgi:hypothetical protein